MLFYHISSLIAISENCSSSPERCGRENGQQYAGPLRRGLHPPHLHPRHQTTAKPGGGDDGEFYGAGHVRQKKQQKARQEGRTSCLALSVPLRTFRRVGHGVGQRKTAKINSAKKLSNIKKSRQNQRILTGFWSCYPDLNWGPHPYQGCALPTEL